MLKDRKKEKRNKVSLFSFIVFDTLAIMFMLLIYGPVDIIRDTWVTTAMETRSHQFLARIFFSENMINKILSKNYVSVTDEETDKSEINNKNKEILAENETYERQILNKDKGNDLYKILNIKGTNYRGWLVVVYKPKNIQLVTSSTLGKRGQLLTELSREYNAKIGINASGFLDDGVAGRPSGFVIVNHKIVCDTKYGLANGGMIGIDDDGILILSNISAEKAIKRDIKYAVQFSPYLIVNGKKTNIVGTAGGLNPRTGIAQRKDKIMMFLIIDGRRPGYSMGVTYNEMTKIFKRYGAYNAANLDGGSTTTLTVNKKLYNRPTSHSKTGEKKIPDAFILK